MSTPQYPLRLLIAGGGTGGHVLPAIAVVEELRRQDIPMEILWVGSHKGVEKDFAVEQNIPFRAIQTGKLRKYFSLENILDAARVPIGIVQAFFALRSFKPDVIFATGSNVSVPTVVANLKRVPILTHEQTAQVSISNKTSARFVHRFACSYEATAKIARGLHNDVVVTGNPVRTSLQAGTKENAINAFGLRADLPLLFVTGGARGASAINERIEAMIPGILEVTQIVHQTGPADANPDFARLNALRDSLPVELKVRYQVRDMIRAEMADLYAAADLVIGRAGAGTVAELAFTGTPAILIPLGGTWGDEQRKNAALLKDVGGALVMEQSDTSAAQLEAEVRNLITHPLRLRTMAEAAASIGRTDAAANVVNEILDLAGR